MGISTGQKYSKMSYEADQITDDYRLSVYLLWYNGGKPSAEVVHRNLKPDEKSGIKPTINTVREWIKDIFIPMALELDEQVSSSVNKAMVSQRIEMLDRHAVIARDLQEMGMEYLREHGLGSAKSALMAVIKGVEMEHEARIIPTDILAKLGDMSDDKLLDVFTEMINSSSQILELTPNTDANHTDAPKSG
jgi:hypothetical protein